MMKATNLILKFEGEENEYIFENKVALVNDDKLVKNLEKTNIKNGNSSLIFKSMNNTPIYDVIQLKVNMSETGVFLVNFSKDQLDEKKRTKLIEEIKVLKTPNKPNQNSQLKKTFSLIEILNKYKPIYVAFKNSGEIKLNINKLLEANVKFPLLVLKKQPKKLKLSFIKQKRTNKAKKVSNRTYALLSPDYIFILLFALLTNFGIGTAFLELKEGGPTAIFLFIISFVILCTLEYSLYLTLYKNKEIRHKNLHSYLLIFVILGTILGLVCSYFTSKFVLKLPIETNLSYLLTIGGSIILSLITIPLTCVINFIIKKIKK